MIAAVLLAAGRASRFGAPKLAVSLGGRPLCTHAAATIAALPLSLRITVVSADTPDLAEFGFSSVVLEPAGAPLSRSIAIGVEAARAAGAESVLIALADMPFVPLAHFEALLAGFDGLCIGSRVAGVAMPPALFGPALLDALTCLNGDSGARTLLGGCKSIELPGAFALDIDLRADLVQAEKLLLQPFEEP